MRSLSSSNSGVRQRHPEEDRPPAPFVLDAARTSGCNQHQVLACRVGAPPPPVLGPLLRPAGRTHIRLSHTPFTRVPRPPEPRLEKDHGDRHPAR